MKIGVAKGAKTGEVFNGSIVILFLGLLFIFCGKRGQRANVGNNNGKAKEKVKGKDIIKPTPA